MCFQTHVQANIFGMGRDPKLFPEPEKFLPERWLRGNTSTDLRAFSNLVWGHGARMCIGRRFAEQEIYIALAKVTYLSQFMPQIITVLYV